MMRTLDGSVSLRVISGSAVVFNSETFSDVFH